MLEVLKRFHRTTIDPPSKKLWRPDPERLASRYAQFEAAA